MAKIPSLDMSNLLFGETRRMSHIARYNTHIVVRRENVAEHSFYVSFFCLAIATDYERQTGKKLKKDVLLSRAIVHDLDETATGDLLRSVKHRNEKIRKAFEEFSDEKLREIEEVLGLPMHHFWSRSKSMTKEGFILALSDFMSVVAYTVEELECGNGKIYRVLPEVRDWVEKLRKKYKRVMDDQLSTYLHNLEALISLKISKFRR